MEAALAAPLQVTQYTITVSAERPVTAASERSISGEEVMMRARSTPYDFLRLVPNLIIGLHEGGGKAPQYMFRGFDADHGSDLAMYFDGIPINEVSHVHGLGYLDPHFIIPEVVARIDVQKGPYDARNGSFATAGALRMTTRSFLPKNEVSYTFGSFESHRVLGIFSPQVGKMRGLFALEGYGSNGFTAAANNQRYNVFSKLHFHLGGGNRFDLLAISYGAEWQAPGLIPEREIIAGRNGRFGAFNPTDGGSAQRNLFALTFQNTQRQGTVRAQVYLQHKRLVLYHDFTGFLEEPVNGDQIIQQESRLNFGGEVFYAFTRRLGSLPFSTIIGGQWRTDSIHPELWRATFRKRREIVYEADITQSNFSLYAKERISFGRRVTLGVGLRYDFVVYDVADPREELTGDLPRSSGSRRLDVFNPKVNLTVQPTKYLQLFGNFGTGFRTPDARTAVLEGAQGIARTIGAEAGLRLRLWSRRLEVTAIGWWMDTERDVVFIADSASNEEIGSVRRLGAEFEVRARLLPWLWLDWDFSATRARFRETDALVPRAPVLLSAGGFRFRHPSGVFASLRARYVSSFPLVGDGSRTSEAYFVTDLVLGYGQKRFQVALNIQNLFNASWRDSEYYYESIVNPAREPNPVGDVHLRPGEPFLIIANLKLFF